MVFWQKNFKNGISQKNSIYICGYYVWVSDAYIDNII